MSIDTRIFGDPVTCYACADSLANLAAGVNQQLTSARAGRSESEHEFIGTTGDEFRRQLDSMISGTAAVADQTDAIAAALRTFADQLVTARARMTQAETTAADAGLPVEFGIGIGEPIEIDPTSYDVAPQVLRARQVAAYNAALELVAEGREIEGAAHSRFAEALRGPTTILKDAEAQWGWLAAFAVTGYIGTAFNELSKWGPIAADRAAMLTRFRELAAEAARLGDPYPEATAARAIRAFQGSADDAARFAAENSRLLAGLGDNLAVKLLGLSVLDTLDELRLVDKAAVLENGSVLGKVGSKIPGVGLGLTALQTYADVTNAEDSGDAVKAVAKDVGGFVAGTVATELILASAAGGPVTLLAVGAGVGVAFGVGEVIEHWDDISGGAGSAARWVGDLF
ncbi:hypothetical protein F8M49_23885 [Rhodococcus zopfii]|uniref:WXG100 family type VII secretion target n=1 Tax=Rhodococcus zopfii TaxID=43772 RepID=A0ABU3WUJ9_9NOCA|nr:hypothetical protein [Rhodococcus zopfii]